MFDTTNTEVVDSAVETTEESSPFMEGFMNAEADEPEVSEPVQADDETTENAESVQPEVSDTIPYTYNHATTQLPRSAVTGIASALKLDEDTVVKMLQKGSNYDALVQRQQPYEPLYKAIRSYAKDNGIDPSTALKKVMDAFDVVASEKYARELRKQYPGTPPAVLQELARNRAAQAQQEKARAEVQNQADAAENQRREMWVPFFRNHPEVTSENLSPRMLEALQNGENPELIYAQERIENLTKQNEELLQKQSNASRSPGSARKTSGSSGGSDFMQGFFGK